MAHSYASQFRAMVVEQVRSGRKAAEVVASLEIPESTVFCWVRQDRGELAGTSSIESAELRAAKQRIAELEAELARVKRASQLFDEGRVVRPKSLFPIVETLASEGHGTKRVCRPRLPRTRESRPRRVVVRMTKTPAISSAVWRDEPLGSASS